ncbi:MAG: MFS transporter [Anaerovoracaceae bacterium]
MGRKLTLKDYIVYGSGSTGDSTSYVLINLFLMFFLTTVAGIRPAAAGVITAVGAVWNSLFNPIIGYAADHLETRHGKRRPLIAAFSIPLCFMIFLLFTDVPFSASVKPLWYAFILMLFWTSYTGYFVPYTALGVDYTTDYQDRVTLRLSASFFNMLGNIVSIVCPTLLVQFFRGTGLSLGQSWSRTALVIGIIAAFTILVTALFSGEADPPCPKTRILPRAEEDMETAPPLLISIFREYLSVLRLRPTRRLALVSVLSLICYSFVMNDMVYMMTYNLNFSSEKISFCLVVRTLFGLLFIPLIGAMTRKIDKTWTAIVCFAAAFAGMVLLRITGISGSGPSLWIYILINSISTCSYWSIIPSMYYDICDYDFLVTGKRRESTVVSLQGLIEAISGGIGSLLLGLILQAAGFNGSAKVQSALAMKWILNCTTVIPVIFLLLAAVVMHFYPLTRKAHEDVLRQIIIKEKEK